MALKSCMATLSSCFFCLFITYSAQAQYGFTEGFIIKNSGDTVKGFIKQRNSKKLSINCQFKPTKSAKPITFTPSELFGFRFQSGKYFISKQYKTEKDVKQVFMEYLVKGKANMFYFRDGDGDHYLVQKEGDKILELTEPDKVIRLKNQTGMYKPVPKYKGKLIAELVPDCNNVQASIMESKLTNPSLIQLAKEYHDCVCTTESCIIYEKKSKPIITYALAAGYSLNRYNFGDRISTNFGSGIQFGIDVNIKKILSSDEKFIISTGLFFERDFSFTLSMDDKNEPNGEDVTYKGEQYTIDNEESLLTTKNLDIALNVSALKIPIILKYSYATSGFSIDGGFGISNRFVINSNSDFVYNRFDAQYGKSIRTYSVGPTALLKATLRLPNQKAISLGIIGDYLADPKSINQFLRLKTTQLTFRLGYIL